MDVRKFMDKYLTKEEVKEIAEEFDFKQSGTKAELIKRIISDPDFELDDITGALYKEDVQEICRDLDLRVSGTKDELWDSIVDKLGLSAKAAPPKKPVIRETQIVTAKDLASIVQIIQNWFPARRYKTEEGYQAELRNFLEYKHNLNVREEAGPTQVDILVQNTIPIELKKNPSRDDFDRLSGQIDRHIETYGQLIVLICQLQTRDLLKEYIIRFESRYSSEQLIWITK